MAEAYVRRQQGEVQIRSVLAPLIAQRRRTARAHREGGARSAEHTLAPRRKDNDRRPQHRQGGESAGQHAHDVADDDRLSAGVRRLRIRKGPDRVSGAGDKCAVESPPIRQRRGPARGHAERRRGADEVGLIHWLRGDEWGHEHSTRGRRRAGGRAVEVGHDDDILTSLWDRLHTRTVPC